jgi:hypothetical protein
VAGQELLNSPENDGKILTRVTCERRSNDIAAFIVMMMRIGRYFTKLLLDCPSAEQAQK